PRRSSDLHSRLVASPACCPGVSTTVIAVTLRTATHVSRTSRNDPCRVATVPSRSLVLPRGPGHVAIAELPAAGVTGRFVLGTSAARLSVGAAQRAPAAVAVRQHGGGGTVEADHSATCWP